MRESQVNSAIVGRSLSATVAKRCVLDYPYWAKALVLVGFLPPFITPGMVELKSIVNKIGDPVDLGLYTNFKGAHCSRRYRRKHYEPM